MTAVPESLNRPVSDALLMERLAQRDSRALIELERRYGASLYALVYAIVMDPAHAERVVARVFEHMWHTSGAFDKQRHGPRGARGPWNWLRHAARELAYSTLAGTRFQATTGGRIP